MSSLEQDLRRALERRSQRGSLRALTVPRGLIDFCSNDYLGFARSSKLHQKIHQAFLDHPSQIGSTGSRLLSGNSVMVERLEQRLADFHRAESGLIFNSGFDLNSGLFATLPQPGDTLLFDEFIHASVRDGMRLSRAGQCVAFRHNDVDGLRKKMKNARGNIIIAVESVYSMDGDFAPLLELADLCDQTGASLVVDEAHATGVFGEQGRGRVSQLELENRVFARVHTFGKALGTHGAIVLGPKTLRDYLINYAHPFIYTTALPIHALLSIHCAYDLLLESENSINALRQLTTLFQSQFSEIPNLRVLNSDSPIQGIIVSGNDNARQLAQRLQAENFDVRPILSPTVPKGTERIRICLHAHNTPEQIIGLASVFSESPQLCLA